VQLRGAEWWV